MPAAIPIVAQMAAGAVASSLGLGALAGSMLVAGAGMLGAYVANKMVGPDADSQSGSLQNIKLNTNTTQRTIPLVYGEQKAGGNDVFIEVTDTDPKFMYIIHCLGEGECEGIKQEDGHDLVYVNEKLAHTYPEDMIEYWFHSGSASQDRDHTIELQFDGKFDDPMRNTAYVLFKIKYDKEVFTGVPSRTVIFQGLKVKDYRTGAIAYTQNPALILYDYLTNTRYGLGFSEDLFDAGSVTSSWWETANYCDLDDPAASKKAYYIDYFVGSSLKAQSIIDTILSHFRGVLTWFGGTVYLKYSDLRYEAPLFSITDDHIARDENGNDLVAVSQPNSFGTPDGFNVKFLNKRNEWTIDDFPVGDSNGNISSVQFNAFSDRALAEEFAIYLLERQRLNRTIALTLRPSAIEFDVNDVGVLSSTELALTNQLVRVKENSITPDGMSNLLVILESYDLYDSVYDPDFSSIYTVNLPRADSEPGSVTNIAFVEELYDYRGRVFSRLKVEFDPPPDFPWFSHIEVYFRTDPLQVYSLLFNSSGNFTLDPIQENVTYSFRLNSVSEQGIRQEDVNAIFVQHKVGGLKDIRPPSPLYLTATVTRDTVDLYSPFLFAPEITLWEYRMGFFDTDWNNAMFLSAQKYSSTSYSGARPGTYNILLDTWRDNSSENGLYSNQPVHAEITVDDPVEPFVLSTGWFIDYEIGGVHSNTESFLISAGVIGLRCTHTNGVLTGTYTSAAMMLTDDAIAGEMLSYVDYQPKVVGTSDTWNGVAPQPTIWNDLPATSTWVNILGLGGVAPRLNISLLTSPYPTGPFDLVIGRLEVLIVSLKNKYAKVQFTIVDPNQTTHVEVLPSYLFTYELPE